MQNMLLDMFTTVCLMIRQPDRTAKQMCKRGTEWGGDLEAWLLGKDGLSIKWSGVAWLYPINLGYSRLAMWCKLMKCQGV